MFDWNNLRFFLAVARRGSTLAAGAELNTNQTTAARRVAALEESLGARLFERQPSGYKLSAAGREILATAERMEQEALTLERLLQQRTRRLAGAIRVATNETLANIVIMPCLGAFSASYPDIRIEVLIDERLLDIDRGEADVALRASYGLADARMVGRRLRDLPWSVYCSAEYAQRRGAPANASQLAGHPVVAGAGPITHLRAAAWLEAQAQAQSPEAPITRSGSIASLMTAVKAGLGVGALPTVLADSEPDLVVCFNLPQEFTAAMWLITRAELKDEPYVRIFNDFVAGHARAARAFHDPRPPGPFVKADA